MYEKNGRNKKTAERKRNKCIIIKKLSKWLYVTIYVLITEDHDIFGCKDV
jgi:hypothetical protein